MSLKQQIEMLINQDLQILLNMISKEVKEEKILQVHNMTEIELEKAFWKIANDVTAKKLEDLLTV